MGEIIFFIILHKAFMYIIVISNGFFEGRKTILKKLAAITIILLGLVLFSCSHNVTSHGDLGTIQVVIDSANDVRSFDSPTAQANVDLYEVVVYNDIIQTSVELPSTGGIAEIQVPADGYKVLVLAGMNSVSAGTKILLGSGVSNAVTVTEGLVTPVNVTLNPASVDITVDATTYNVYENVTGTVTYVTGCPVLLSDVYVELEVGEDATSYTQTTANYSIQAPGTAGTYTVKIGSTRIHLKDSDPDYYQFLNTLDIYHNFIYTWEMFSADYLDSTYSDYYSSLVETITVEDLPSTGISITITWS